MLIGPFRDLIHGIQSIFNHFQVELPAQTLQGTKKLRRQLKIKSNNCN